MGLDENLIKGADRHLACYAKQGADSCRIGRPCVASRHRVPRTNLEKPDLTRTIHAATKGIAGNTEHSLRVGFWLKFRGPYGQGVLHELRHLTYY